MSLWVALLSPLVWLRGLEMLATVLLLAAVTASVATMVIESNKSMIPLKLDCWIAALEAIRVGCAQRYESGNNILGGTSYAGTWIDL